MNAPQPLTAGSGPTTIADDGALSQEPPIARLNELKNLAGLRLVTTNSTGDPVIRRARGCNLATVERVDREDD